MAVKTVLPLEQTRRPSRANQKPRNVQVSMKWKIISKLKRLLSKSRRNWILDPQACSKMNIVLPCRQSLFMCYIRLESFSFISFQQGMISAKLICVIMPTFEASIKRILISYVRSTPKEYLPLTRQTKKKPFHNSYYNISINMMQWTVVMAHGRNGASAQKLAVEELKNEAENVTNQDQSAVERNAMSLDQTKKLKSAKRKAACSVSIYH